MMPSSLYESIKIDYGGEVKDDVFITLQTLETYNYIKKELENNKFPLVKSRSLLTNVGSRIYNKELLNKKEHIILCYSLCNEVLLPIIQASTANQSIDLEVLRREIQRVYKEYEKEIVEEIGLINEVMRVEILQSISVTLLYKIGIDLEQLCKRFSISIKDLLSEL